MLPISHDEVVHGKRSLTGKRPGDTSQRLANTHALLAFMWAHPGKQLLFMGCELADDREWSEARGLDGDLLHDPARADVQRLVRDLHGAYRAAPAPWDTTPAGILSLDHRGRRVAQHVRARLRGRRLAADWPTLICVANLAGVPHEYYRIGLPVAGTWAEIVNTDSASYGGSSVGNLRAVHAGHIPEHGLPASAVLRVSPLGALWLRPERRGS